MASDSKAAARERRRKSRAIIDRELERCQHLTDTWYATMRRQVDDVSSLANDLLSDEPRKAGEVAADLFALWVGFQADACDLLHETYTHCLNDDKPGKDGKPGKPESGGSTPRVLTVDDVEFDIQAAAEAADPQRVDVAYSDRARLRARELRLVPSTQSPAAPPRIPERNVRVSTYDEEVFVSLVNLRRLRLASGAVYEGPLELNGQQIAKVRVRVG